MSNETKNLAQFCASLKYNDIPQSVVERVKLLLLDTIGIIIRARLDDDAGSTIPHINGLKLAGLTQGNAHVFGDASGYTPYAAAMLNGSLAHSLDFDDTHAPGGIHTSAPVIAAAFAAGEIIGASMKEVIAGIVAGYEAMARISLALGPTDHSDKGFHLTATCGVFAAAAASGRVLGLSGKQIEDAFGSALSLTAGSGQFMVNGAWTKRFHVGAAAANGLISACLAKENYSGAAEAFEGKAGFFNLYGVKSNPEILVAGLGEVWETLVIAIKPYPCCRAMHASIDGALALLQEQDFSFDDIASIKIGMQRKSVDITGLPQEKKRNPQSIVDGQFSAHFTVTSALEHGSLGWEEFGAQLKNPRVISMLKNVEAYVDPEAQAEFPHKICGSIDLILKDGRQFRKFVPVPLGEPENMLSLLALRQKYSSLVVKYLGNEGEQSLFDKISNFEIITISELMKASCEFAK